MNPVRESRVLWLHVCALMLLSVGFESLFVRHGLNVLDEGWPLYAAAQLHAGGTLYDDVFFVFPPGHLLSAWLGYALDPPGVVLARCFYAAFNVALCLALYFLGRRLMPPACALLGAAFVAVAAPDSHNVHYLFGYRYLVFSVLALLCLAERLRTGERRWMIAAGSLAGVALLFRLTPAMTVTAGIGVGVVLAERSWRSWWEDGSRFALGFAVVLGPALAWFAWTVGLETLWQEAVGRPIAMTDLQSRPVPAVLIPSDWNRWMIRFSFVTLQFRLWAVFYVVLGIGLLAGVARSLAAGRRFEKPLLAAVVTWAGLFFLRSFGRADEAHLDSTVPAACLLLAWAISLPLRGALARDARARRGAYLVLLASFGLWVFLTASDRYLNAFVRGTKPVQTLDGAVFIQPLALFRNFDQLIEEIEVRTAPDDVVLDLTSSSLVHVVSGRWGPGHADVLMPGTFLDPEEESAFVARLEASPPALVILPTRPFDGMAARASQYWAPEVTRWVRARYRPSLTLSPWILLVPRAADQGTGAGS